MDDAMIIERLNGWIDSVAGHDGQYGLVEDWLIRGKVNRTAVANSLGLEGNVFEQACHLHEPTKVFDEFADMLRKIGGIKVDVNIKRFNEMVTQLEGEEGKFLKAKEYLSGSKLNRKKIIDTFGIGKKSFTGKHPENPELARLFNRFEDMLKSPELGIITKQSKVDSEDADVKLPKGALSLQEAAKLQQRILELEAENEALKRNRGRFKEVAEVYRRLEEM